MPDAPDERLRDAIEANQPYLGLVAEAYDAWFPVDADYADAAYFARRVEHGQGLALEIGCGTGRLLLRYLASGLEVEGLDDSPDMLAICRAHARERGLDPVLHEQRMEHIDLDRRYRTIYIPASTFRLVDDRAVAQAALRRYCEHLEPGGRLLVAHAVSPVDLAGDRQWRLRRTGSRGGTTFVVHEAVAVNRHDQVQTSYLRIEAVDASGRIGETLLRKQRVRWYERDELSAMLRGAGFAHVEVDDGGIEPVFIGRR
jgi:SAM-dependent methyltransferase